MKYSLTLPIILGLLPALSYGHQMVTNMIIDGVDQGLGKCMRIPPSTDPVVDITSKDMTCNVGGTKPVARSCVANVGSQITFMWRTWPDGSVPGSIDKSHRGPCSVYMKKVDDSTKSPGTGLGWFKVFHDGYRGGKWCSERIAENNGRMTVTIPKDLRGGDYLIRAETVALHQAQNLGGAQWYIGCGQLILNGAGGNANPSIVSIPGYVKAKDSGVLYDIWNTRANYNSYVVPGPKPYVSKSVSSFSRENRKERGNWNCVAENANWCGRPVPGFTSEDGCWNSAAQCWKQLNECYNQAPATGNKGCVAYEKTCARYQAYCEKCGAARNCNGKFPAQ